MRIDALQLIAFGPFTGEVLDLSRGREGLHLVYGRNEAGKSSALQALRDLLFGIPMQTDNSFLHPYAKMRIGAALKTADGKTLQVVRRKGRVGTLRAADDNTVVDESELQPFLLGVDAELFATMFGISHGDLVEGGREIIQGGGDVGRLVFSAGSGIANLREIQAELEAKAADLFLPRGQRAVNEQLKLLKDRQKEQRDALLTGRDWAQLHETLQRARSRKNQVDEAVSRLEKERRRLQRIEEALPLIARRRELAEALDDYADAVLLSDEFGDKRRQLEAELNGAAGRRQQARHSIEAYRRDIAELTIEAALLENAEVIEEFHRELGSQRKAGKDRVELEIRRRTLLGEAKDVLHSLRDDLTLEQAETLRIKKTEAVRIQKLGAVYERIHARMAESRRILPEAEREIAGIEQELAALPDPRGVDRLQKALAEAVELGPAEKQLRVEHVEIDSAQKTAAGEQARLGLEARSLAELERLPVPTLETAGEFEKKMEDAAARLKETDGGIQKARAALSETDRQIEAGRLEQQVPTEEDLGRARAVRDRGWRLIAAKLGAEEPAADDVSAFVEGFPEAATLAGAFEAALQSADAVSDRLRREADRVVAMARLLADRSALHQEIGRLEQERRDAAEASDASARKWARRWRPAGVAPRSPREMTRWIRDFEVLSERVEDLRRRRARAESLGGDIAERRRALSGCLKALGEAEQEEKESLAGLIKRAEALISDEQSVVQTRRQLLRDKARKEKDRAAAAERLAATEAELDDWQQKWKAAMAPIGLGADALPEEAAAFIEELKELFEKLKEAGILQKRIEGIERDAEQFVDRVQGLVRVVVPDLEGRPAQEAAVELNHRLKRTSEAFTRRSAFQKQLDQEKKRLAQADSDIARFEAQLAALCREAGCKTPDRLAEAEKRSNRRRALESELRANDDQLRRLSAGATVEAFIAEADGVEPDAISGEIGRLGEEIERLEAERSELDQQIGIHRNELGKMDGTSRAAALAEDIQTILGRIEGHSERYARLKIAAKVLSTAVERYRDKSQGPILKRASELFCRITDGSFEGLRAEFDENGRPVIVGVRARTAETVSVEGMSDGTADQLYLALRIAGLEQYLKKSEPLPFVVDDILIMFDNDRAAATLRVLAELSKKTQVIFFTHHRHLVALAEKSVDPAVLIAHTLSR